MTRSYRSLLVLALATAITTPAAALELTLTVAGIPAGGGDLRVGVFADGEGFPDPVAAITGAVVPVDGDRMTLGVTLPAPGRYAVAVHHDRDGDGHLDRNWAGLPEEPVAFSRGATALFGPPAFTDAAVEVPAGGRQLGIRLGDSAEEPAE